MKSFVKLKLDSELVNELSARAKANGISLSILINDILKDHEEFEELGNNGEPKPKERWEDEHDR